MLPVSAISDAANKLRTLLSDNIGDLTAADIRIGHPKQTLLDMQEDKHHLNLFFYNVTYDGYPADGASSDPFYLRLYCLITAVGGKSNNSPSMGENDLRLIGEVMRVLHEDPVVALDGGTGKTIASLEIVPHPLTLDNLNHIWSTQGDTAYRLSVAYEMALAPVPLARPEETSPLTGSPFLLSWGTMARSSDTEKQGIRKFRPEVSYLEIDAAGEDWIPHICLMEKVDDTGRVLHYVFEVTGDLNKPLEVLIAGKNNGKVKFFWDVWRRKTDNNVLSWKEGIADMEQPEIKEIKKPAGHSGPFYPDRIDPDDIDAARVIIAKLPDDVRQDDTKTWQAVLYAVHEWRHEDPDGSGRQITTTIKSNPLLLYGDGS